MKLTKITKTYELEPGEDWSVQAMIEQSGFFVGTTVGDRAGEQVACQIDVMPYVHEEGTTVEVVQIFATAHPVNDAVHP